ncbi:hypothetical protein PVAG01_06708 [Phlyctema vagabunda]|uniref:Uncharacterized protein n=1 Tax=Phlyctema vagabunda TaxID=108571 RepID=A0ABR4PGV4_9HELO
MICKNLEMRDRVVCLSLSKAWKRTLESSHKLWTFLNTRPARRAFGQKALRAYLRRSNYTLDTAWITMGPESKGGFNDSRLSYLTRTCQQLQNLEISGPGTIGDSLVKALPLSKNLQTLVVHKNCEVPLDCVVSVLNSNRATLREVSFLAVRANYRSLTMQWPEPVFSHIKILRLRALGSEGQKPRLNIDDLVEAFPNVEHVVLDEWSVSPASHTNLKPWAQLKHLDVESIGLTNLPLLPHALEHLNISYNVQLGSGGERDHTDLPLLKSFNCYSTNLDAQSVAKIIKPSIEAGNLKVLRVGGGVPELPGHMEIEEEYPASSILEEISLANMNLSELRTLQIINQYPNLKRIELSGSKITGVAVKHFVKMGVTYLKVNECAQIGADAIAYARSMGVEVVHTFVNVSAARRSYVSRMQELY